MSKLDEISRRRFLRGFGTLISLPMLECMLPSTGWAAGSGPIRIGFFHHPCGYFTKLGGSNSNPNPEIVHALDIINGKNRQYTGRLAGMLPQRYYRLFEPLRGKITTVGGISDFIDHLSRSGGLNAGHGKAHYTAYSNVMPTIKVTKNSAGKNVGQITQLGKTIDIAIAEEFYGSPDAALTYILDRYPTYKKNTTQQIMQNPSTISPGVQQESIPSLRKMFESIFQGTVQVDNTNASNDRIIKKRSILDYVLEDVNSVKAQLGAQDRIRLDEYLTGVDELSKKVDRDVAAVGTPPPAPSNACSKNGIAEARLDIGDKRGRLILFQDLMIKAFECNRKPIVRFDYGKFNPGSASFADGFQGRKLTGSRSWHESSHASLHASGVTNMRIITEFIYDNFVKVAQKMDNIIEADGRTLLDNSLLVLHSSIGDSEAHTIHNLCYTLAGSMGGRLNQGFDMKAGMHVRRAGAQSYQKDAWSGTSISPANLWLTILKAAGSTRTKWGDSTGVIDRLIA